MTWKEQQRELTERAKLGRRPRDIEPGQLIRYSNGPVYEVQPDRSFRRVTRERAQELLRR